MVLGALRYLGRGLTFDDIEECTSISEETHRQFFHLFITYGSDVLFDEYIVAPMNASQAEKHMAEFTIAGFNGCVGSSDATHVMCERISHRIRQNRLGFKMNFTARTYNLTVNHRRQILSTTHGHPARWNDKTLVLYDQFVRGIYEGNVMNDVEFILLERGQDNNPIPVRYRGAWLIVDNGYHQWPTTVPPLTRSIERTEIRWSEWLESMRKDVECTFGILKGRFHILKTGI
jgi:hypothetical protein